jgi:tetratricopeptide (TPR) repeat protein
MKIIKDQKRDEMPTSINEGHQNQFPVWRLIRLLGLLVVLIACLLGYNGYRASLPEKYQNLYLEANQNEDWKNAEFWARKWTEVDNNNGDAWLALGDALQAQQKWQELSDAMSQFPMEDKRVLKILDMRGDLLVSELNDIVAAQANDLKLLNLAPLTASARQRLTYIYSMTLQREKLSQLLRDSVQLQCEPQEAYYYLFSLSNLSFSDGLLVTSMWLKKTPESDPLQIGQAIFSVRTKPGKSQSLFDKE